LKSGFTLGIFILFNINFTLFIYLFKDFVYDWTVTDNQQNQNVSSSCSSSSSSAIINQIAPPASNNHVNNDDNNNNNNIRVISSTTNPVGQTPVSMNSEDTNNNNFNPNINSNIPNLFNLGIISNNAGVFDPQSANLTPNGTPTPSSTKPGTPNLQQQVTISINTIPGYKLTHAQQQQLQQITANMQLYHNEGKNIQNQLFSNQQQQQQLFQLQMNKDKNSQNAAQYHQQLSTLQQQQQHLSSQLQQINTHLQKLTHQIQAVGGQGVQVIVNNPIATSGSISNSGGDVGGGSGNSDTNRPTSGGEGKDLNNKGGMIISRSKK
jgi:hypothetical protein